VGDYLVGHDCRQRAAEGGRSSTHEKECCEPMAKAFGKNTNDC